MVPNILATPQNIVHSVDHLSLVLISARGLERQNVSNMALDSRLVWAYELFLLSRNPSVIIIMDPIAAIG